MVNSPLRTVFSCSVIQHASASLYVVELALVITAAQCNLIWKWSPHLQLKGASTISPSTQTPTCPMGSPVSRMLATISPSTWAIDLCKHLKPRWVGSGKLSHGPTQRCEPCEPGVARVPISFPGNEGSNKHQTHFMIYYGTNDESSNFS